MQILDIPHTQVDMVVKIGMNGITHCKVGRFKKRHYGAKDFYECPGKKFYTKAEYKKLFPNEFVTKKPTRKKPKNENTPHKEKKVHSYSIDKGKVKSRLATFYTGIKGEKQLYFWTITFPQGTTEQTGHKLFNIWLTRCREELRLSSYLWIKELQKNGTIHFHMAIHQRMDVKRANRYMRASIMYAIEKGEINWAQSVAARYNGVDIAKDRKTKRVVNFAKGKKQRALQNYLTKYVTKNDTKFQMLAWHCSRDYSNTITSFTLTRNELIEWKIFSYINRDKKFENDYFTTWYWTKAPPGKVFSYLTSINTHIRELLDK